MSIPLDLIGKTKAKNNENDIRIALVGQPNVGKSVLFNQLTGANQHIANFPGITLTYLRGRMKTKTRDGGQIELVDLPGFYSFSSKRAEEAISQNFLTSEEVDLIVNVIDARKLVKNLALTLQIQELGIPIIVVLTYWDKMAKELRNTLDITKLSYILKCQCLTLNSHNNDDIKKLISTINTVDLSNIPPPPVLLHSDHTINILEQKLSSTISNYQSPFNSRQIIILSLLSSTKVSTIPAMIRSEVDRQLAISISEYDVNIKMRLLQDYHHRSEEIVKQVISGNISDFKTHNYKDRLDEILLHPVWGLVIFFGLMTTMFVFTFYVTDPVIGWLEFLLDSLAKFIWTKVSFDFLASLLADGLVGGIGFVMVFIPQIAMLFFFMGIMEQSGYMTRVVFLTDQYLSKLGISGPSIAPLLLGLGCNVPGIMAIRAIPDRNERITVGLVNPFVSCSARLPVYVVISSALFPENAGIVIASMYFIGIIIAILIMYIFRRTILPGESQYLLMELPTIERPQMKSIVLYTYRHLKGFVNNAASWMALGILLLWFMSITGPSGYLGPEGLTDTLIMQENWISFLGQLVAPVFSPMGWDTRLIMALILGFIAKEIVIGSLGLLYGVKSGAVSSVLVTQFTPISAYAFMIFVLLYTPCIGTYMAMRHQLGKKWANFSLIFSILLAYLLAIAVILLGKLW